MQTKGRKVNNIPLLFFFFLGIEGKEQLVWTREAIDGNRIVGRGLHFFVINRKKDGKDFKDGVMNLKWIEANEGDIRN